MVDTLLRNNRIKPELLATIELPYEVIKRTDIYLLQSLQGHGVPFSATAKAMIEQKAHRDVGAVLAIGIRLMQFMDWLRDIWREHFTNDHANKHLMFRVVPNDSKPQIEPKKEAEGVEEAEEEAGDQAAAPPSAHTD